MTRKRFLITAALPYANGPIHIGHLSGVYLPADIFARYLKVNKKEVLFISGTDEYGVPITIKAKEKQIEPQQLVDKYHVSINKSLKQIGIKFDNFSRTTSKIHYKNSISFFNKLYKNNLFLEYETYQYYDNNIQQFLPDRYILGICPNCKYKKAYGDQCENCGISFNLDELLTPYSAISKEVPQLKPTRHLYMPLNKYQQFLIKLNKNNVNKKHVYAQVKSYLNIGLNPRAITRDLNWGIPVPQRKNKVLYVWFEALLGYISSTIELCERNKTDWKLYWQNKNTSLIQFIGKDNIFFHCLIFPVMLKAHGSYILPETISANEFLNIENRKISTSKNWAIWLHKYLKSFPNQQDVLRYVLIRNMPEKKDTNFSWKIYKKNNNSELVSILGNFIFRILSFIKTKFNWLVPVPNQYLKQDIEILSRIKRYPNLTGELITKSKFRKALLKVFNLAKIGNKYLSKEEPWNNDTSRRKTVIYISLQIAGLIGYLLEPFLPLTSEKILRMMFLKTKKWKSLLRSKDLIKPGIQLGKNELLFNLVQDYEINKQIKQMHC
ncbi:methionine--tRNA ligase [Candidatus Karelsulcia muelleri]